MATGLVTGGVINRELGPAGRGALAEMQTWVGLFVVVFGLSLDSAFYHFANRERFGDDDRRRFVTAAALILATALCGAAALVVFIRVAPGNVSADASRLVVPLGFLLVTTVSSSTLTVFFQSLGRVRFAALLGASQAPFYLLLIVAAAGSGQLSVEVVIASLVASQTVTVLGAAVAAAREGLWRGEFSGAMARGMLGAGARLHAGTIATFCYMKANQVLVYHWAGAAEAGLYAAALNLSFAFAFVPAALQQALYPRVIHSQDDFTVTVSALRLCFWGWGAASALLALLAEPLLLVYAGGEFRSAVPIFRVLLLASWLLSLGSLIAPYLVKAGVFWVMSASAVAMGAVSLLLNGLLVPAAGGLGAGLATMLTCAGGLAIGLVVLARLSNRNPLGFLRVR
jgi:O-antigen/teichoic acid export membrane protein